jgi:hypothetical protein
MRHRPPRTFLSRSEAAHRALQLLRRTLNSIGARVFVLPAQAMVRTCAPARTRAIELSMEHAALVGTPGRAGQFSASSRCYWCAV